MRVCINIDPNLMKRLESIKQLINLFAGLTFDSDSQYFEFLLNLAVNKILNDILSDPESRLDLIKMIFREHPEIVVRNMLLLLNENRKVAQEKSKKDSTTIEAPMYT